MSPAAAAALAAPESGALAEALALAVHASLGVRAADRPVAVARHLLARLDGIPPPAHDPEPPPPLTALPPDAERRALEEVLAEAVMLGPGGGVPSVRSVAESLLVLPERTMVDAFACLREATTNEGAIRALGTIVSGLATGTTRGDYEELLRDVTSATGRETWFGAWMSLASTLMARIVPEGASKVGPHASGALIGFCDTTAKLLEAVAFFKEDARARGEWPKLCYSVMGHASWPQWYIALVPSVGGTKK
jgi:hypothetical protein